MARDRYVVPLRNQRRRRPLDRQALLRWAFVCIGGLTLAVGFGFAAWQQQEALRLGYEAQQLRSELNELIRERDRLETERQRKLSPMLVERLAQPYNFARPQTGQTVVVEARP
ncbi:MAG: hypothetical protein NZ585_01575 [Chloracidobacterium sp.]|nr:hypothetical protein [Chloracidobacterium sp.]MDW8216304.1 hypothetical protein [Acidobacteriota bacterium]